jgi:hypothetical protein
MYLKFRKLINRPSFILDLVRATAIKYFPEANFVYPYQLKLAFAFKYRRHIIQTHATLPGFRRELFIYLSSHLPNLLTI